MTQPPKMIERRMVFGVREDVKDGIQYLDDNHIVWVAGKSLVILNTQLGTQSIIPCSLTCESVTAMALSSNRRVLAVAESGKTPAIVLYLFDSTATPQLKRKKVLQTPDLGSTEFTCVNFSLDGKHLVALGGFPEWRLVYWNVEKGKMVANCAAIDNAHTVSDLRHLNHCTISPNNDNLVCVSGKGVVKFFDIIGNHLFPSPGGVQEEGVHYLSHVWIPNEKNRLVVCTANGDLLLFDEQQFQYLLPLSPSDGLSINSMITYSKGFICGGDMGLITIFERTDNKEMYRKVRTFRFSQDSGSGAEKVQPQQNSEIPVILAFCLTPPPVEENLALLTSTKQIYYLNLPNADFTRAEDTIFQPVGQPFHTGPITGIDVCAQRPLAVSASRDGTICLWNTMTNNLEMRKRFKSEILSVAIHPSGMHLLVGFADGLKLMNLYAKDICEFKSIGIRSCSACCFSHGGQFFAAMHSTTIHIYFTYTCELLGHLRGHNGKVKSLFFVPPDDTRLISTGTDGAVYEFSLTDFHKVNDNVMKAVTYNCGVADVNTVWVSGNDRRLRQIERARLHHSVEYDLNNASMLSMAISSKMKLLFGGCEDGTVRVFNTYLGERRNLANEKENQANRSITMETHSTHTGSVTKLALSYDEGMIISAGEDGVVVFWDVIAPHRGIRGDIEYSNELLMDRHELEAAAKLVAMLSNQVTDLRQRMVQQQLKRERLHEEQIVKLEKEYGDEMTRKTGQISQLDSEKNEQAIRFTEFMAELEEKSKKALSQTDEDYASKIDSLRSRADQLKRFIAERRAEFEGRAAELRQDAGKHREEAQRKQQDTMQALEDHHQELLQEKERHDAQTETMCKLIEDDNDVELIKEKENYEKRRREQEEELSALATTNNAMLSKENLNKAELEAKMADVMEKLRQQGTLEAQIEAAKRDIEALTNELRERGDTIADKDRRIYDLKKKNQELEKFKFVLEYKIKELKAQIDPRDEEIRVAKEKLTRMKAEAEQYQHSNEGLVLQIRGLRQKRAGQQKEVDALTGKMKVAEEFQARLWTELSDVHEELQNNNARKQKELAKALFDKYASAKQLRTTPKALTSRTATDEVREYNRERDHLERNLASLKKKVNKDAENNRTDKNRIIAENVILIKEINDLRKEARTLAAKAGVLRTTDPMGVSAYDVEFSREIEVQRSEITRLKGMAETLEAELKAKGIPLPTAASQPADAPAAS